MTGMMAFWADIDTDYVTEFRRWHNCEHMAERVAIPGFVTGRRYCGNGDAAMFLMYYETETPEVLASEAYHAALNSPTPWTGETLKHFQNPARNIYRLEAAAGPDLSIAAPFVATIRFNLSGDAESITQRYRDAVLPQLAADRDVRRARLWTIDADISGIMTSERKLYGGGPGQQQYLLFIELTAERGPFTPDNLPGLAPDDATRHQDVFAESGWLDFALETAG
jgi:hypothetical protein